MLKNMRTTPLIDHNDSSVNKKLRVVRISENSLGRTPCGGSCMRRRPRYKSPEYKRERGGGKTAGKRTFGFQHSRELETPNVGADEGKDVAAGGLSAGFPLRAPE